MLETLIRILLEGQALLYARIIQLEASVAGQPLEKREVDAIRDEWMIDTQRLLEEATSESD